MKLLMLLLITIVMVAYHRKQYKKFLIEYDERIYNRALANKTDAVSGNRVQFLCEDAVVFKIADNVDRFFFFNPFSIEIFKSVLANIIDSYYEAQAILNALVHRDYSIHTEGMPIQIIMFENRIEIRNPGGIYGRIRIDQLGKVQPDTRNPIIALELEVLKITENRYSGIPTIRRAMREYNLPEPEFLDERGCFIVKLYKYKENEDNKMIESREEKNLIIFCKTTRTRNEICHYLGINSVSYVMKKYVMPLVERGILKMSIPDKPKSTKQLFYCE